MRYLAVMFTLTIALALSSSAQTAPPPTPSPNDGVHFVEDSAFYQLSGGKQATVFTARIPMTSHYSPVFSQWFVPTAKGNISMGGLEYRSTLGSIFKNSKTNMDLNKFEVFGRVQVGSETNSIDNSRKFAYGLEGGLEYPVATLAGRPVKAGARFGFLGVPGAGEHIQLGSQATISPNVSINF